MLIWSHPAAIASSTPYWMMGLSTIGSISLGCALVAGRNRVPKPAAGKTALRTFCAISNQSWSPTKKPPGKNMDAEFLRIPNNRRKLLLWHKGRDIIRKREPFDDKSHRYSVGLLSPIIACRM